jgi:hypothetical protein
MSPHALYFGHIFKLCSGAIPNLFRPALSEPNYGRAMRLLQIKHGGELSLVECVGTVPPYAILSHTWGSKSDEVSYQDMINGTSTDRLAYRKSTFCIEQATKDNLTYFWIDTCCISNVAQVTMPYESGGFSH